MQSSRDIGFDKETEAVEFLKENGYKILERNYRTRYGEIDVVAFENDDIVFVEVKYRKTSLMGLSQETVTSKKRQKIIKTALFYVKAKAVKKNIRFDVVAINGETTELIKSAFTAQDIKQSGYY